MTKPDGGPLIKAVDAWCAGKGLAMAQAKVIRANGGVEYHFSAPDFPVWDLKSWIWYWVHKHDIKQRRQAC